MKIANGLVLYNENRINGSKGCENFMNDVIMKELWKKIKDNPNVQNKTNTNLENEKKIMKMNLKKLHA